MPEDTQPERSAKVAEQPCASIGALKRKDIQGRWGVDNASSSIHKQVQLDEQGCELAVYGCLKRTPPPPPPTEPPCGIIPQNTDLIKKWFLNTYTSSSFNTCPHQPLPLMTCLPPLRILIKPGSDPVAKHRPATIPAHWVDQVWKELEQDIALGV